MKSEFFVKQEFNHTIPINFLFILIVSIKMIISMSKLRNYVKLIFVIQKFQIILEFEKNINELKIVFFIVLKLKRTLIFIVAK